MIQVRLISRNDLIHSKKSLHKKTNAFDAMDRRTA